MTAHASSLQGVAAPGSKPRGPVSFAPRPDRWAFIVLGLLSLGLLGLLGRVAQLQISPNPRLVEQMGDRVSSVQQDARRGDIVDRRGRLIACTRFGYHLVIDPIEFPGKKKNIDEAIVALADALGEPVTEVGGKILTAAARNEQAIRAAGLNPATLKGEPKVPGLDRYVPVGPLVLTDPNVEAIRRMIDQRYMGIFLQTRAVREMASDELVAPLVGKVGFDGKGIMGVEARAEDKGIEPKTGSLAYVRDAAGHPMWVLPGGYNPPQRGQDVTLAIDLEIQRVLQRELERGVEAAEAAGGLGAIVDVETGDLVALADVRRTVHDAKPYDFKTVIPKGQRNNGTRYIVIKPETTKNADEFPALRRNRIVEDVYEPGSTFKPFMWSSVMERGLASVNETLVTQGPWAAPDGRILQDVTKRPQQTVTDILVNSSNIGMVKLLTRLTPIQMREAVLKFGFGKRTGIELPGETNGRVTPLRQWNKPTHTSVAIGHEIAVTPVQMIRAFSVFCRTGENAGTLPDVRLVVNSSGDPQFERVVRRVLPPEIAELTRQTMRGVTHKLDEKMRTEFSPPESGWRYELFGKSGTAKIPITDRPKGVGLPKGSDGYFSGQYNSSFIAGGPVEHPRLAIIIIINDPGPRLVETNKYYGALVAGPVARRVMDEALAYLGVPASPPPTGEVRAHGGD